MNLPKNAGAWSRLDVPKRIDETSIFSYMDGGGELYLAYRFDHLDVYEYTAPVRDPILVELYWMKSADDAFGLLSNDWGGEPIVLDESGVRRQESAFRQARALYGAGLLRVWSDTLYARILASRETPESRDQVMALGRAVVAGRANPPAPALMQAMPASVGTAFTILAGRACFLRSHLVLNSAYFLSSQNILDLSPAVDAAIAPYDPVRAGRAPAPRPYLLVARYPDPLTARRAFEHFMTAYLPEAKLPAPSGDGAVAGTQQIEHGWVGYRLRLERVALAFDAPDKAAAEALVGAVK